MLGPFKTAAGQDGEVFVGFFCLVEPLESLMKVVKYPTPKAATIRIANQHWLVRNNVSTKEKFSNNLVIRA